MLQETALQLKLLRFRPPSLGRYKYRTSWRRGSSTAAFLRDGLAEPIGRNTAAAIGLAAVHLAHQHGDALMAVLQRQCRLSSMLSDILASARPALRRANLVGNLVVLGVPLDKGPETGYGYIERGDALRGTRGITAYTVRRFTEKPASRAAEKYVASGKYFWNGGMFFWRVSTFLENLQRFLPATHEALREVGQTIGTRRYARTLRRVYPRLENISVDYAIMEPATRASSSSRVLVIPANVGWSDIGSWAAVYELLAAKPGANVSAGASFALDAEGNYLWSPKKFVAAIGVHDRRCWLRPRTPSVLCSRGRSQDVGKVVKWLEEQKREEI